MSIRSFTAKLFVISTLFAAATWTTTATAVSLEPEQLVYREAYPNVTASNNLATVGWAAHEGPTATQVGGIGVGDPVHMASGGAPVPNPAPVNSGPDAIFQGRTYGTGAAGLSQILWTDEYSFSGLVPTRVQWYTLHTGGAGPVSAALRIGPSDWYVSNSVASNTGTVDSGWTQREVDLIDTTWTALSFTPGSVLSLTGPVLADLPGGDVTAFGYFEASNIGALRFDTFELFAAQNVPEPSSLLLSGFAMVGLLRHTRRRRQSA